MITKLKNKNNKRRNLNAIITSNSLFKTINKKSYYKIKTLTLLYGMIIFCVTLSSFSLLLFSEKTQIKYKTIFSFIEIAYFVILIIDFFLWWYTARVRLKKRNLSYIIFPFSLVGIILMISLLPSLYLINIWTGEEISIFRKLENMKFLRIFRLILLSNLIPALSIFKRVISKEKQTLYVIFSIILISILVFALVIYNIENSNSSNAIQAAKDILKKQGIIHPKDWQINNVIKIHSFLDALYFSTISLTTIGFGDISPITQMGKIIVMIMSFLGIAILAAPSGIIAGGFIQEIKEINNSKRLIRLQQEPLKKKKYGK